VRAADFYPCLPRRHLPLQGSCVLLDGQAYVDLAFTSAWRLGGGGQQLGGMHVCNA